MATLGNLTGASSANTATDEFWGSKYTATEYGTSSKITCKIAAVSGTVDATCFVFSNGGTSAAPILELQATSAQVTGITTTASLVDFTLNYTISAGTSYWLVIWASGVFTYFYDAGAANQTYDTPGNTYPVIPQTENGGALSSRAIQIYMTYTPRAADNSVYRILSNIQTINGLQIINY